MPELNLDGIVGPTHNYAGLSYGNVASTGNQGAVSQPRKAARQGLAKMAEVAALGIPQGYLPPHERPHLPTLRRLGYRGRDEEILAQVARADSVVLARCSSASAMWAANAATVIPSCDSGDGRLHLIPANLRAMFHRSIEPPTTAAALRAIFPDTAHVAVHQPLPSGGIGSLQRPSGAAGARAESGNGSGAGAFGDEGAANHSRLTRSSVAGAEEPGIHLFVYGGTPRIFPARQTPEASRAVARLASLPADRVLIAEQNPDVIDRGVFHNDVISVANGRVLLHHESAYMDAPALMARLNDMLGGRLIAVAVTANDVTIDEAVRTYLFNSQLLTLPDGTMVLVAPIECKESDRVRAAIERIIADTANPISRALYLDVRESMRNGGGPACLRLRVPVTEAELAAMNQAARYTPQRHRMLEEWVDRFYPESLAPADLADPGLLRRGRDALDDLTRILSLGSIYDFQR